MFKSMINEYGAGNIDGAREHQIKNNEIISALFDFGGPQIAGKAIMKMLGVDCGPCRLPLSNLSEDSISNLSKKLKEIGFFELNS
jgi:N-acetylneuraminate lyase